MTDDITIIRDNARGSRGHEAAAELIIAAFGGRFIPTMVAWLNDPDEDATLASHAIASSGELRVLRLAEALMRPTKIDLADVFLVDNVNYRLMRDALDKTIER